jgi:hypothetical protein
MKYKTIGGGPPLVTSFADSGNRANGPLGSNWSHDIIYNTPFSSPTGFGAISIGQNTDLTQGIRMVGSGTNNPATLLYTEAFPVGSAAWPNIYATNQYFVQYVFWEYIFGGGSGAGFGGMVDGQTSTIQNGYLVNTNNHANTTTLERWVPNGSNAPGSNFSATTVVSDVALGIHGLSQGDTIRISIDRLTTPGSSVVRISLNGTLKFTYTDGTPIPAGGPGLWCQCAISGGVANIVGLKNFSCGIGL